MLTECRRWLCRDVALPVDEYRSPHEGHRTLGWMHIFVKCPEMADLFVLQHFRNGLDGCEWDVCGLQAVDPASSLLLPKCLGEYGFELGEIAHASVTGREARVLVEVGTFDHFEQALPELRRRRQMQR